MLRPLCAAALDFNACLRDEGCKEIGLRILCAVLGFLFRLPWFLQLFASDTFRTAWGYLCVCMGVCVSVCALAEP